MTLALDKRIRALLRQRMPFNRVTGEVFWPPRLGRFFERDRQARVHVKLLAVPGRSLADAFHLGSASPSTK